MSLVVRPGVAAILVAVAAVAGCTAAEPPAAETTAEETTAEASALTVPGSVEAEPAAYLDCDFSDHVDSALEAVWQVKAGLSNGTAFHIGGGQWLTAEHVISGRSTVTLHNSGASITATVEAANRAGDTALLLTSSAPSLLGFGSLSETGPGHQAYAVGFPLYDAPQASVSRGIVSRIERHAGLEDVILTDAAVNPGNSGGPLLNECGQVIGMNVSRLTEDDAVGLNYAVAEPTLRTRVAELGGTITDDPPTTQRTTPTTTAAAAPPTTTLRASLQPPVTAAPPTRSQLGEWNTFIGPDGTRYHRAWLLLDHLSRGGIVVREVCNEGSHILFEADSSMRRPEGVAAVAIWIEGQTRSQEMFGIGVSHTSYGYYAVVVRPDDFAISLERVVDGPWPSAVFLAEIRDAAGEVVETLQFDLDAHAETGILPSIEDTPHC